MKAFVIVGGVPIAVEPKYVVTKKHGDVVSFDLKTFPKPLPAALKLYLNAMEVPDRTCELQPNGTELKVFLSTLDFDSATAVFLIMYVDQKAIDNAEISEANILVEANNIINSREAQYGDISTSFTEIALVSNLIFTPAEAANGMMSAQKVVKVMRAVKLIRAKYSPDNRDHLRDDTGYARILEKIQDKEGLI